MHQSLLHSVHPVPDWFNLPKFSLTTGDPLTLDVEFEIDQPVEKTHWEVHYSCPEPVQVAYNYAAVFAADSGAIQVQYMVDMTARRHMLQLGSTDVQDYPAGKSSMHFSAPTVVTAGLKKSWLNNVGLLLVPSRLPCLMQGYTLDTLCECSECSASRAGLCMTPQLVVWCR